MATAACHRPSADHGTSSMSASIDFYYDYSSPYGYLASERIGAIAERHGRELRWCPILLGAIFKVSGSGPLTEMPMKGEYALHDFARSAREHGLSYSHPDPFPIPTVAAARLTVWARDHEDASIASKTPVIVQALYRALYVDNRAINDAATAVEIVAAQGIDANAAEAALNDADIKGRLRQDVEAAVARGVFGSPTVDVDGELFWGSDRLEQIDRWLERGGW